MHNYSATKRVLIVDDEPHIVTAINFLMENEGYTTAVAYNGREAVEKAVEFAPNVIIMDVMMPEMTGVEAATAMRKTDALAGTHIIFLTAKGADQDKLTGYGAGADMYLVKPVSNDRLVEVVVLESFGVVEQHRGELGEPMSRPRMCACPSQPVDLFGADSTVQQCLTDVAVAVDEGRTSPDAVGLDPGAVHLFLQVPLDGPVAVLAMSATHIDHR